MAVATKGADEKVFKVITVGDYAVGKTSLLARYCNGEFSPNYKLTIGVDFVVKSLEWDENTMVNIQYWDIAGHERFGSMTSIYYKHCIAAIIVYDVARATTFDSVLKWKKDIDSKVVLANGDPIPAILLANKCDMGSNIDKAELDSFCAEHGFLAWFATSAKDDVNVDEAMSFLTEHILKIANENVPAPKEDVVRVLQPTDSGPSCPC